jgi:hypothetical protein
MKKLTTLAMSAALGLAASNSQAQIAIDGVLNATEISSTNYQLVGRYTGSHGFGDVGLLSLYAAADANKVYFFLAGTLDVSTSTGALSSNGSFQIFIDRPGVAGASNAVALPVVQGSTTAFG